MKYICPRCGRVSPHSNLWCQAPDCPAGNMPTVFDFGEWLGDIEVVRLLRVLRLSSIYEAKRDDEMVLLKVAHNAYQHPLRNEAILLAQLAEIQQHPVLPVLLPAYQQQDIKERPYGKITYQGEERYYTVFEYIEGEFLRDMLRKNPQPWCQHAAWLTMSLTRGLAFLHAKAGGAHLNLSPDVIFVRLDRDGIPRPVLLDLGMEPAWVREYGLPAYVAPELIADGDPGTQATDVYGLGLVLYEMLAGQPVFESRFQREADTRAAVVAPERPLLNRTDFAPETREIIEQAISRRPGDRQPTVRALHDELASKFGKIPAERKGRRLSRRVLMFIALVVLVIVALTLVALLLG